MSLAQRMHFLQDVFQMTAIALVTIINHYHINRLHLSWDTLYDVIQNLGFRNSLVMADLNCTSNIYTVSAEFKICWLYPL